MPSRCAGHAMPTVIPIVRRPSYALYVGRHTHCATAVVQPPLWCNEERKPNNCNCIFSATYGYKTFRIAEKACLAWSIYYCSCRGLLLFCLFAKQCYNAQNSIKYIDINTFAVFFALFLLCKIVSILTQTHKSIKFR